MNICFDQCSLDVRGSMATVTLNCPDVRNVLGINLLVALLVRLDECLDRGVDVLVVRGEGPVFCAGLEGHAGDGMRGSALGLRARLVECVVARVQRFPASVAVVHGAAVDAGWSLAFATATVIAADDAVFTFLRRSTPPPDSLVERFVRTVGKHRALRLLGSNEAVRADSPVLQGLVQSVPRGELDATVDGFTRYLAVAGARRLGDLRAELERVGSGMRGPDAEPLQTTSHAGADAAGPRPADRGRRQMPATAHPEPRDVAFPLALEISR